jgi:hypothetical protein
MARDRLLADAVRLSCHQGSNVSEHFTSYVVIQQLCQDCDLLPSVYGRSAADDL